MYVVQFIQKQNKTKQNKKKNNMRQKHLISITKKMIVCVSSEMKTRTLIEKKTGKQKTKKKD